jgi:hypothetical protein
LFFPAMAFRALIVMWTSVFVIIYEWPWTPIRTLFFCVNIELWFSSKVLPIMSEYTLVSLMVILVIWTPYCFEVKHVEIYIFFKLVDQFYRYFSFRMCKGTKVSVFTFTCSFNIRCTELSLVLIWMIKFLNSIMSLLTVVSVYAFLTPESLSTHFRLIRSQRSSLILLLVVIIRASF